MYSVALQNLIRVSVPHVTTVVHVSQTARTLAMLANVVRARRESIASSVCILFESIYLRLLCFTVTVPRYLRLSNSDMKALR